MKHYFLINLTASLVFLSAACLQAEPWRVSEDKRNFIDAAGEPVLYLADTAWELFHKLDREDGVHYLEDRARKGFTVIQAVLLAELDGLRKPNAYGDLPLIDEDPTRPNEAYFLHVDFLLDRAEELGLQMALLPTWGDKVVSSRPGAGPVVFNAENAAIFGEYLGNRYAGRDVVWIVGGDRDVEYAEAYEVWDAMARGLRRGGRDRHLISFHPVGAGSSADHFHDADWLDFNMYQSGHSDRFAAVYRFAQDHLLLQPRKPFVEGEPAYEDIPVRFWEYLDWEKHPGGAPASIYDEQGYVADKGFFSDGFFTDYDVRVHAYWNLLAGAAGYAYGNNAIWQMRSKGEGAVIPTLSDWKEALDRPGAASMRHVRALFESRPFNKLLPDQSLVFGSNPEGKDHIRAAIAEDGSFALVYLALGQEARLVLEGFSAPKLQVWWFDPREGTAKAAGSVAADGIHSFTPPSSGEGRDWVLVLDSEGSFDAAPGEG